MRLLAGLQQRHPSSSGGQLLRVVRVNGVAGAPGGRALAHGGVQNGGGGGADGGTSSLLMMISACQQYKFSTYIVTWALWWMALPASPQSRSVQSSRTLFANMCAGVMSLGRHQVVKAGGDGGGGRRQSPLPSRQPGPPTIARLPW